MPGLHGGRRGDDDPLGPMSLALDEAGYTSVVATNCDQVYYRYLRHGEQVSVRASLLDVTGPKRTALGEGWFVTTRSTWYAGDEAVAAMDFRILKFRPPGPAVRRRGPGHAAAGVAGHRVLLGRDRGRGTADPALRRSAGRCATRRGRCAPGAGCPSGRRAARAGTWSRPVPARSTATWCITTRRCRAGPLPLVIALVELPEGVRMVGELLGVRPDQVRIGLPVRAEFVRVDDDLTLPAWRPAGAGGGAARPARPASCREPGPARARARPGSRAGPGSALPELAVEATPDLRDLLRAGDPRLPGRPSRPGPGRRPGQQGHLHQHPDHHRTGPAVRVRLGRPAGRVQVDLHPARGAVLRRATR